MVSLRSYSRNNITLLLLIITPVFISIKFRLCMDYLYYVYTNCNT